MGVDISLWDPRDGILVPLIVWYEDIAYDNYDNVNLIIVHF